MNSVSLIFRYCTSLSLPLSFVFICSIRFHLKQVIKFRVGRIAKFPKVLHTIAVFLSCKCNFSEPLGEVRLHYQKECHLLKKSSGNLYLKICDLIQYFFADTPMICFLNLVLSFLTALLRHPIQKFFLLWSKNSLK